VTTSITLLAYKDVWDVIDSALARGGARYKLATPGAAVHWRQRAYVFRKLAIKAANELNLVPGFTPSTPYDHLHLTVDGVFVIIKERKIEGTLEPLAGAEAPLVMESEDDLLANAEALLKEKGGEE